jgi:hypothetical protein
LSAAGFDERHAIKPADFIFDTNLSIKRDQIGAERKEYVLAVVDNFAGTGMFVGRGSATEIRSALEQGYAESTFSERARSSESG